MTAKRKQNNRMPPYFFFTCPGCDKKGSVMFTLDSLPYDWNCSSCGMPAHLRRKDGIVTLTFDHPDWVKADAENGKEIGDE